MACSALSCSVADNSASALGHEHASGELCRRLPQLQLVWPPGGHGATQGLGVWCTQEPLDTAQETFSIVLGVEGRHAHDAEDRHAHDTESRRQRAQGRQPIAARLVRGASPLGGGWERCVQLALDADAAVPANTALLPPALVRTDDGRALACIDQTRLRADAAPRPAETLSCDGEWQQAGPGCIMTAGRAAMLQTPPQPLLWIVHAQHTALQSDVVAAVEWDTLMIDLPAIDQLDLALETLDLSGNSAAYTIPLKLP